MDQEYLIAGQSLQALFESTSANLGIIRNVAELNSRLDKEDDVEDVEEQDPAIIASEASSQVFYLHKLKVQCIEQNDKQRYTRSILSDNDNAPIVKEHDNKLVEQENIVRKEKVNAVKAELAALKTDFKALAPKVEEDYIYVKQATTKATELAQKIIDARLALSRLKQIHPQPRVTVETANKKLEDQITEMQTLGDRMEVVQRKVRDAKGKLKADSLEVETLKLQRNEAEKNVEVSNVLDDDRRFVPLYDWLTGSLILHRSMQGLEDIQPVSENELRLRYRVGDFQGHSYPITITLLFLPNTRQIAAVNVDGLEEFGIDLGDVIEPHLNMNDVPGVVAAILGNVRESLQS